MSLLFRAPSAPKGEARNVTLPGWVNLFPEESATYVDTDTSMRHDAVWSCRTRIAQDVSMMPVDVIRYVNGTRQEVTPTPQIIAAPSSVISAMDWRYQLVDSWLGDGNAWGIVTQRTSDGRYPVRIELRNHSQVRVDVSGNRVRFMVDEVEHQLFPIGDLWHSPAHTMPGHVLGLSPIQKHAATIGRGIAAGKFGLDFFEAGGHPHTILTTQTDPGVEGAKQLKRSFLQASKGREPAVMPSSVTVQRIQIDPKDSQFIDAMRYSAEQVCRIFGEDPADHGVSSGGSSITYANRSDADLARLKRRQFWIVKLQSVLTDMLPKPQVVRLNTSASLMMTEKERHEVHDMRLKSRTRTVNEVRKIEDETPFGPEFDEPGIPPIPQPAG